MSEDFVELALNELEQKELQEKIISEIKDNQYESYFKNTEKISPNPKYIKDLKDYKDINKVIGRVYCDKKGIIKYVEIYKNTKIELMGISPYITFIHLYDEKFNNKYNENKFIGFRYYEKGPKSLDSNYFTLINKSGTKYIILEKNEFNLKDIDDKFFYDPNLNCFNIIDGIIKKKYKSQNNILNGETFPEIIGYCYGLVSLKKFKNYFVCVDPLIPDLSNQESLKENFNENLEENTTYLEPIICDGHISLVLILLLKNIRHNFIFDMSRYHTSSKNLHKSIFPKNIFYQTFIYPSKPIQSYSSCCLWFYGQIDCLLTNENYNSFKSIFDGIKGCKITFYIDVINTIGKNFFGMNDDLFKAGEPNKTSSDKIDLDRLFINSYNPNYSVKKDIIQNRFLYIKGFFSDFARLPLSRYYKLLIDSQNIYEEYIAYINLLEMNYKFNQYIEKDGDSKIIFEFIKSEKDLINMHFNDFQDKYDIEFIRNNIASYSRFHLYSNDFNLPEEIKKKIDSNDFQNHLREFSEEIKNREITLKEKFTIFSAEEIAKKLNPLNDICFMLMNK